MSVTKNVCIVMKKSFIMAFIGIILLIPVSFIFLKSHIDTNNYENRELAAFPKFSDVGIERYPQAIDDYVTDNFPYKNQFVAINSLTNVDIFNDNPTSNTIKGKGGFIFYTGEEGEALSQYKGTLKYSDDEINSIVDNLISTKEYLEERGCRFVLFITPNKERMYKEYMPDNIKVVDNICNTDQLLAALDGTGIDVIFAYDTLNEYRTNNPDKLLYYKLDTHWNDLGAYIGTKALLARIGVEIPEYEFEKSNYSSYDLANYAGLRTVLEGTDESYVPVNLVNDCEVEKEEMDEQFIYHNTGKNDLRFMMVRDSFAIAMRQYLGNTFNECNMPHINYFENSMVDEFLPDVFVYEACERRLERLKYFRLE